MPNTVEDFIAEEVAAEAPRPDWPKARIVRWLLLHGETLTATDVVDRFAGSPLGSGPADSTILPMQAKALADRGYPVDRRRLDGGRVAVSLRSTVPSKPPPPAPPSTSTPAVRRPRRRTDDAELGAYRAFHRSTPATIDIGTVCRVVMVAEDNGGTVAVLQGFLDGARYFVRVEGAEPTTP